MTAGSGGSSGVGGAVTVLGGDFLTSGGVGRSGFSCGFLTFGSGLTGGGGAGAGGAAGFGVLVPRASVSPTGNGMAC